MVLQEKVIYETSCDGVIWRVKDTPTERHLESEFGVVQSRMFLPCNDTLVGAYQPYIMAALLFRPQPHRILHLGLGGGCMIRFIHNYWEDVVQDVVEKNRIFHFIARNFFYLPTHPLIRLKFMDAANLIWEPLQNCYDIIFLDLYHAYGPADYFYTVEFFTLLKSFLTDQGWLAVNLWSRGTKLKTLLKSWKLIFPQAHYLLGQRKQILLFGSNDEKKIRSKFLKKAAQEFSFRTPLDFNLLYKQLH